MSGDRALAPVLRRLDNMQSRGVLRATTDAGGVQRMQVEMLEGELADDLERIQSYGISSVPPNGGDAFVAFISGNRDHGVVLAVNDRTSRPRDQKPGEVCLYNDQEVKVCLTADGDLVIGTKRHITIEATENITIEAKEGLSIRAKKITIESEEPIAIKGDIALDGDLDAIGRVTWQGAGGGGP